MGDMPLRGPASTLFWERYQDRVQQALERGDRMHAYDLDLAKEAVRDYLEAGGKLSAARVKGRNSWLDPDDWNRWMQIQQQIQRH